MLRQPRLFGLGLIPPLITTLLFVTLFFTAAWLAPGLAVLITPFAEGWTGAEALRALVTLLLVLLSGVLLVLLFTATTLALGAPLYDRISERVDAKLGHFVREPDERPVAAIWSALKHLAKVAAITIPVAVGLLLVGLLPVLGTPLAALGSATFGGWMIAMEMIGSAASRRGLRTFAHRQALLRRNPWLVLGFGIPTFLLLSVPALSLVVFPIATAGGTLLARRLVEAEQGSP